MSSKIVMLDTHRTFSKRQPSSAQQSQLCLLCSCLLCQRVPALREQGRGSHEGQEERMTFPQFYLKTKISTADHQLHRQLGIRNAGERTLSLRWQAKARRSLSSGDHPECLFVVQKQT